MECRAEPELKDELYDYEWTEPQDGEPRAVVITEFEPTFDAADFMRFGRDIVAQKSNVTNEFGIEWLRRHLGDTYRIHVFEFDDSHPMHIDATLVPLAPGKLLINAGTRAASAEASSEAGRSSRAAAGNSRRPHALHDEQVDQHEHPLARREARHG